MRRGLLLLIFVTGCSTAPLAGFLDRFYPGGVSNREFQRRPESGIGVGPPRPIDPLVESPGLSIPNNRQPASPRTEGVVPAPTLPQ
jgi:hypothetical protein